MKNSFVFLALFAALIFIVSCGGGSKSEDKTDTGEDVTDNDAGDSSSTDTEPSGGDTEPTENPDSDNPDTAPDGDDTTTDNDADTDSGDTAPDSDGEEPVNENPDNLPECSPESSTPCIDSEFGLIWSGKAPERIRWIDAVDYCKNLNEGGYSDWRLPTMAALKTLLRCTLQPHTVYVENEYGSYYTTDYYYCNSGNSDGENSKFGDIAFFWSASQGKGIDFYTGKTPETKNDAETFDLRCVRREFETRKVNCSGLTENAQWNSVPKITQTWNWETAAWLPSPSGLYSEDPSTEECKFKCKENYFWDPASSQCLNPCYSLNPCGENPDVECQATSSMAYFCKCKTGYYWWENEKSCLEKRSLSFSNICTGETKCYYGSSKEECPPSYSDYYGQDAYYASLGKCIPQSFSVKTISSQDVIVDNNTGLTWEPLPSTEKYPWDYANKHCADLNSSNYGGINTWRVPNPLELLTIGVPYENGFGFYDTALWTSKEKNNNYAYAFITSYKGAIYASEKKYEEAVLCVSGSEMRSAESSDFAASSNGTVVTDKRTGLMWQKEYATDKTWLEALKYCTSDSNDGGYSDWRLPNKNELLSLMNYEKNPPYSYIPDMPGSNFWSSTGYQTTSNFIVFYVGFATGSVGYGYGIGPDDKLNVRCVRGGEGLCGDEIWNGSECVTNPCNSKPCDSLSAIQGTCVAYYSGEYSCGGKDPSSGLIWSAKPPIGLNDSEAWQYCDRLNESGYNDWHLPTISELRTLIQNCPATQMPPSGSDACGVTDTCLSGCYNDACKGCPDGGSKFGDYDDTLWSSSYTGSNGNYWSVNFYNGSVTTLNNNVGFAKYQFRCVRNVE